MEGNQGDELKETIGLNNGEVAMSIASPQKMVWNLGSEHEGVGSFKNMMIFPLGNTILLRRIRALALMKNAMFSKVGI